MSEPDYIIDIAGLEHAQGRLTGGAGSPAGSPDGVRPARPWLAVHWKCCGTYSRIYRDAEGTAYQGRCPRCGSQVRAIVGSDGTSARFFIAE